MGTEVEAWTEFGDDGTRLRSWFEDVEAACSRFRPESHLSAINRGVESRVKVTGILAEVLKSARDIRNLTDGLVDAGAGAAVSGWGYDRSFDLEFGLENEPEEYNPPDWSFSAGWIEKSPEVQFDLGGVAKGWTCDRAVESGFALVVSAGGDIRSAHPETTVPIIDPWGEEATKVQLGLGALATSSQTRRRWRVGDREVSHIIDPRTMTPTLSPILSASVVAETALEAEAGAKSVLLLGESGLTWADETSWIRSSLVIWHDGSVYGTSHVEVAV
jgi:thiamine biosynthesis lipoprotein